MMKTKYLILVGDGMGDYPLETLDGKTPLEVAITPHLDALSARGRMGLVQTIPDGMEPGSDIANMSLLGYSPEIYHTGRAPLEAASIGIELAPDDVAFRCNLVTLQEDDDHVLYMEDYSAGHITTSEAIELIESLQEATVGLPLSLHAGVAYRHLLVWHGGRDDLQTTPPHDITGREAEPYCKVYRQEPVIHKFVQTAQQILLAHPVNQARKAQNKRPANAVWLWGQGKSPSLPRIQERYGLSGAMISAVDLLKGLGVYAGLRPISVPGATGYLDTNYQGKVDAALKSLATDDFVYLHVEAPDEAGHEGNVAKKIQAIEDFDKKVVGPIVAGIHQFDKTCILVAADHLTPISVRTHVSDPTLFLLVNQTSGDWANTPTKTGRFSEKQAADAQWHFDSGVDLFETFIRS